MMESPDDPRPHENADPSDDREPASKENAGNEARNMATERDEYADAEDAGKGELIVYSLGGIVDEFTTSGFRNLNSLLLIAFQFNPLILGLITALKTIWDGVMDPIVAHLSDNTHTRF